MHAHSKNRFVILTSYVLPEMQYCVTMLSNNQKMQEEPDTTYQLYNIVPISKVRVQKPMHY